MQCNLFSYFSYVLNLHCLIILKLIQYILIWWYSFLRYLDSTSIALKNHMPRRQQSNNTKNSGLEVWFQLVLSRWIVCHQQIKKNLVAFELWSCTHRLFFLNHYCLLGLLVYHMYMSSTFGILITWTNIQTLQKMDINMFKLFQTNKTFVIQCTIYFLHHCSFFVNSLNLVL